MVPCYEKTVVAQNKSNTSITAEKSFIVYDRYKSAFITAVKSVIVRDYYENPLIPTVKMLYFRFLMQTITAVKSVSMQALVYLG